MSNIAIENKVLWQFRNGQPSIGTISHLRNTTAVECLGATGLDFVLLDMEHSALDISQLYDCIIAADAGHITPLVRLPQVDRGAALRALDAGARGIVVPDIEAVEQVETLVSYTKFKAKGKRGYCMTRDGQWGYGDSYVGGMAAYMQTCNSETLLLPQCETMGCLAHIEEITAMEGVDGILVGPFDLSIAMGLDGQFDHPDFKAAVARILAACKKNGKLSMIFAANEADMKSRTEQGFDSVLYGIDILTLISHYKDVTDRFKKGIS